VLSVSHFSPRAALALCWLAFLASPAAAVMPSASGTVPPEVTAAFNAHLFDLDDSSGRLGVSAAQTLWRVPVILVGFADQPIWISRSAATSDLRYVAGSEKKPPPG